VLLTVELRTRALESGKPFKAGRYSAAIRSVESYHKPISSGNEMAEYPGVGPSTAEKIQEMIDTVTDTSWRILRQGTLKRLSDNADDERIQAINLFTTIDGFGPLAARDFVNRMTLK
jgi:DNA polymerase/3'-5' exonuclease PolX